MHFANDTAYDLNGPPDAPAVVLIHGLGLTRDSTWGGIAPRLSARFRVLTYDLPGHGDSALPTGAVSLRSLSDQLVALLDDLGIENAALVGFSLGGMVNRRCAMDHPDRVSALAVLNSPHERGPEAQDKVEARARDVRASGPAATIDATIERWFTPAFRRNHPDTVAQVRATVLANDPDNYAAHYRVLAQGVRELIRPDPPIRHPAMVMTCENDSGSTPAMTHAIASEITGAETVIVPGLQHLGLIEEPVLFADRIEDFLDRAIVRSPA